MLKYFHLFIIFIALCQSPLFSQEVSNTQTCKQLKGFADQLFTQGFLDEAAGEYRRYIFACQEINIDALHSLLEIYRVKNDANGILWLGASFGAALPVDDFWLNLRALQAKTLFKKEDRGSLAALIEEIQTMAALQYPCFAQLLPASALILNSDIAGAAMLLNQCSDTESGQTVPAFEDLALACANYREKSPALAVLLSGLLPGAGRWYTGSFKGGLSSLIGIASLGGSLWYTSQTYGWENWRPWVFSGLCLFTYTVELYGAGRSARRSNEAAYRNITSLVEKAYDAY